MVFIFMMDLNEHIKRMKDLFLAEHGIVKPLMSEQDPKSSSGQVMQASTSKDVNVDALFDVTYLETTSINNKEQTKVKSNNPNFDAQLDELKKNPAYKPLMEKLDEDEKRIFYLYLTQISRLQFLNQTLEFLRSFTKRRKLEREVKKDEDYTGEDNLYDWGADLTQGDVVKTEIPGQQSPQGEDSIEFEIPFEVAGKTVYKENSTEPDLSLIQAIDNWISNANATINQVKAENPNAVAELVSIEIASSCSRLRNTGDYEGKTWNELSRDRGEKVYNLITQNLAAIGVTVNPKLQKVLRGGYNGDGSSGPDPANKFTFYNGKTTNGMSYSSNGADRLSGPDSQRKVFNYGQLLSTQLESDQYKFCIVLAKIKISGKKQTDPEPLKPSVLKSQGYSLLLYPLYKTKPIKLKARKQFKVKGGGFGSGGGETYNVPKVKGKLAQCAAYGNKIGS